MSRPQAGLTLEAPRRLKILSTLKGIVKDLLGIDVADIDIHARFLEVGVESLILIQFIQVVQDKFNYKVSLVRLLEDLQTLDALAGLLDQELAPEEPPQAVPQTEVLVTEALTSPPVESAFVQQPSIAAPDPVSLSSLPSALQTPVHALTPDPIPWEEVAAKVSSGNGTQASGTGIERIMAQQLSIMSQQLELVRNNRFAKEAAQKTVAIVPMRQTTEPANPAVIVHQAAITQTAAVQDGAAQQKEILGLEVNTKPYLPYKPIESGPSGGLTAQQQEYLNAFMASYCERTKESKRRTQAYRQYLADGANSAGFRSLWKDLVYQIHGKRSLGSRVWDVDGNEYVDITMGFGVLMFGHTPRFVTDAMAEQLEQGIGLGPQSPLAEEAARLMCELTGFDRAVFCNSGTEAVMAALRAARTYSRKNKIALFAGAYHGWSDGTVVRGLIVDGQRRTVPGAPGVPPRAVEDVMALEYDSPESLEILKAHMGELAAVIVEPIQSRRPDVQPKAFLQELRRLTSEAGTILIFDEMITGFRSHPGGIQALYGIQADLATYGKIIGGGLPIGAVAGKAEYMDVFDGGMWSYGDSSYPRAEKTLFAGAFFRNPLTMAAAVAIFNHMKSEGPKLQERLTQRTTYLAETLNSYFEGNQAPIRVVHFASLFRFVFGREFKFSDLFFYHLIHNGLFTWEGRNYYLSTAHTDEDIECAIEAVKRSVEQLQKGGFLPGAAAGLPGTNQPASGTSSRSAGAAPGNGGAQNSATAAYSPAHVSSAAEPAGAEKQAAARQITKASERLQFSLYYFGNYDASPGKNEYDLIFKSAKLADKQGFAALWLPERHFHSFGGFSPNPSVIASALATQTERIKICAGSVVLPLHNPIRVAEEWAIVDNLSNGRAGISFASGWRPDDFVFAPDAYERRREIMMEGIKTVQELWRGESLVSQAGAGKSVTIKLCPMPVQADLPTWLTMSSTGTCVKAGEIGANILTNLQDQSIETLAEKIAVYRESLLKNGHDPRSGRVTVLLHTLLGDDLDKVRQMARKPFYEYIASSLGLFRSVAEKRGPKIDFDKIKQEDMDYMLSTAFERYVETSALIGTPDSCSKIADRMMEIGVDEIGCLIDFGIDRDSVLKALHPLNELRQHYAKQSKQQHHSSGQPTGLDSNDQAIAYSSLANQVDEIVYKSPLGESQKQAWMLAQLGDEVSRQYNESIFLHLRGPFNLTAMRESIETIVDRHDALRSTFSHYGDYQLVHSSMKIEMPVVDFSTLAVSERDAKASEWLEDETGKAFDLMNGPLLRVRFARLEEQNHIFTLTVPHVVSDGHSWAVILGDLGLLYASKCQGVACRLPQPMRLSEQAERLLRLRQPATLEADEAYWLDQFSDSVPILDLPTDHPRPPVATHNHIAYWTKIGPSVGKALKDLSKQQGCTLFVTMLGAFKVLLHQLSGGHDIVVGINSADPSTVGRTDLVSFSTNPLAIRSSVEEDATFPEHMAAIRRKVFEAYEHQSFSASKLIKKLKLKRDPSRPSFVTVGLNLDVIERGIDLYGLQVSVASKPVSASSLDLYLDLMEHQGEFTVKCNYNPELFEPATVQGWMKHFEDLLQSVISDPSQQISALPRLATREQTSVETTEAREARPGESEATSPLTKYQQLIWAGQKLAPDDSLYINAGIFFIHGALDRRHFQKAFQMLVNRSDALRTVIEETDAAPRQRVLADAPFELGQLDFSDAGNPRAKLMAWANERCRIPFNLEERLFDSALIKISDGEFAWYLNVHHVIADAWSVTLIVRYGLELYKRSVEGDLESSPELPQFKDYVEYEREIVNSPQYLEAESYWSDKLSEEYEPVSFYGESPVKRTTRVQRISYELDRGRTQKLKALASRKDIFVISEDASLFNLIAAALCAYLFRVSGNRHLSIGAPFHNRRTKAFKGTIGLFMKMLPLHISIEEGETFSSLVKKIANEFLITLRYHEFLVGNPLNRQTYDVECNYINATIPDFEGSPLKVEWLHPGNGNESLALQVHDLGNTGSLFLNFDLHQDIFDERQRACATEHFIRVLDAMIEDGSQRLGSVSILTTEEKRQLLVEFNKSETEFPPQMTFPQLFEAQVARTPNRLAAQFEGQSLTYAQLNDRADRLAQQLRRLGVGPDLRVGLLAQRSMELLTAVLAVFKAGGAYVPLDPLFPPKRTCQVLSQSGCLFALASNRMFHDLSLAIEGLPSEERPQVLRIEDLSEREQAPENFVTMAAPDNLSYVIFTSGSTGVPKGAMVTHRGMLNHLRAKVLDAELKESDVIAQTASQCFDISVWQFLATLLTGGQVLIVNDEIAHDPVHLLDLVDQRQVSILEIVPSLLRAMLEHIVSLGSRRPNLSALRWLFVTGEAVPPELCRQWLGVYPRIPLMNAYGPTECSDDVTHYVIDRTLRAEVIHTPIGRPIANTQLFVLDQELTPVPIGVPAELHVGGIGVGRGYINDPQRTAAVFIPNPFSSEPGARLYKTGDLARYLHDGNIEFLGRIDHQVKIRGHRIELGEIELALSQHSAIRQAVVLAREDAPGDKRLVAYIVTSQQQPLAAGELRAFLKERLPEYMAPSHFVTLDEIPLTPNGKVDTKALPAADLTQREPGEEFLAPSTGIEEKLAEIWAQVIGVDKVGVNDNFFELGGDSILSIQVAVRANKAGLKLRPMMVFQHQTIGELAAVVGTARAVQAEQGLVTGHVPLTPIQRWFFGLDIVDFNHWNQAVLLEVKNAIDPSLVEKDVQQLIYHHDALRLRFIRRENGWEQFIADETDEAVFLQVDLSSLPASEQSRALQSAATQLQASLNLTDGPIIRVALFTLGESGPARLLLIIHHLAVDGVSWPIILEDFHLIYQQLSRSEAVRLPDKTTSLKHWAERLDQYAQSDELRQELDYWVDEDRKRVPRLPLDYPEGENTMLSARSKSVSLTAGETQSLLQEVPEAFHTQINEVLLVALAKAFSNWTSGIPMLVNLEGHGREQIFDDVDLSRTVGWFTTLVPVLIDISAAETIANALMLVKEQVRDIPRQGIGHGLLYYLNQDNEVAAKIRAIPPAEVTFNYLGQLDQLLPKSDSYEFSQDPTGPAASSRGNRGQLFEINGFVINGQLRVDWAYSKNLHSQETIAHLTSEFLGALREIIAQSKSPDMVAYTPSDFPRMKLSQEDLNELLSDLSE